MSDLATDIDAETIDTDSGEYVVRFIHDEHAETPFNHGLGFAFAGEYLHREDVSDGDHASDVLAILRNNVGGWHRNGTPGYQHSSAGIARYLRLAYGLKGIREVSSDYQTSTPDATLSNVYGIAWAPDDATYPDSYTKVGVGHYRAWAEGDVFGYVVEGPDGNEIDSCWGFYGFDDSKDYALEQARASVEYDVTQRIEKSNLVGAGFVGLI